MEWTTHPSPGSPSVACGRAVDVPRIDRAGGLQHRDQDDLDPGGQAIPGGELPMTCGLDNVFRKKRANVDYKTDE